MNTTCPLAHEGWLRICVSRCLHEIVFLRMERNSVSPLNYFDHFPISRYRTALSVSFGNPRMGGIWSWVKQHHEELQLSQTVELAMEMRLRKLFPPVPISGEETATTFFRLAFLNFAPLVFKSRQPITTLLSSLEETAPSTK